MYTLYTDNNHIRTRDGDDLVFEGQSRDEGGFSIYADVFIRKAV